mmetsp:Transcript_46373/g.143107  ORF Transcript_46373/g.143107 Transcript_46373/m.143107 type:complete len:247 (-) Transcript_46373:20-760(-)
MRGIVASVFGVGGRSASDAFESCPSPITSPEPASPSGMSAVSMRGNSPCGAPYDEKLIAFCIPPARGDTASRVAESPASPSKLPLPPSSAASSSAAASSAERSLGSWCAAARIAARLRSAPAARISFSSIRVTLASTKRKAGARAKECVLMSVMRLMTRLTLPVSSERTRMRKMDRAPLAAMIVMLALSSLRNLLRFSRISRRSTASSTAGDDEAAGGRVVALVDVGVGRPTRFGAAAILGANAHQ